MTTTLWTRRAIALAAGATLCLGAAAQQAKAPKVQLWMDVSTGGMAGMPEMDGAAGGMLGGMLGGRGGAGANTAYGAARGMTFMPPRVLDIALYNSLKPGQEAQQLIPAGMRMGDSLPLVPPRSEPVREREPGEWTEGRQEKPKGRILIYWGCGDTVRKGQPRVIDLARAGASDFGAAFAGRYAPDRGARVTPQHALYPNERNRVQLGRDSSLVGDHRIEGPGVPASMKFTLGAAQDLMPQIDLRTRGGLADSVELSWGALQQARAYYIQATGQVGDDLVMWSSAETGDTGMGLFDYLPNGTIDRWLRERVLLKPETTACAVPKGIFNNAQGAMARMIAYGSESNIVHPPRPTDPKAPWDPEWAVRVRVKSNTMAMLGEDSSAGGRRGEAPQAAGTPGAQEENRNPVQNAVESVLPVPGVLRGLFGR